MQVVSKSALLQSLLNIKNDMKLIALAKDRQVQPSSVQVIADIAAKTVISDLRSPKK